MRAYPRCRKLCLTLTVASILVKYEPGLAVANDERDALLIDDAVPSSTWTKLHTGLVDQHEPERLQPFAPSSQTQFDTDALADHNEPGALVHSDESATVSKGTSSLESTYFSRFATAMAAAFSLTLVSEIGDRTFFVAAMLATKWPKLQVWFGACLALWLQSIAAATLGALLHAFPANGWIRRFPLDDYLAGLMLCVFGFLELSKAIRPGNEQTESPPLSLHSQSSRLKVQLQAEDAALRFYVNADDPEIFTLPAVASSTSQVLMCVNAESERRVKVDYVTRSSRRSSINKGVEEARRVLNEATIESRTPWWKGPISESFWLVFVAEFGDGSMFSTTALATAQNPAGVMLGASAGHSVVTALAVSCGVMMQRFLSARMTSLIAGSLFITFGVLALVEGCVQQGLRAA